MKSQIPQLMPRSLSRCRCGSPQVLISELNNSAPAEVKKLVLRSSLAFHGWAVHATPEDGVSRLLTDLPQVGCISHTCMLRAMLRLAANLVGSFNCHLATAMQIRLHRLVMLVLGDRNIQHVECRIYFTYRSTGRKGDQLSYLLSY